MSSVVDAKQAPVAEPLVAVQQDNIAQLSEISRNSGTTFFALILACVYSYLTIATTTDAALLSNSSATPLPIIQVNVPIVWFYYFAPVILAVLFLYFHLYLKRFWRCVVHLPLRHPDGRGLDDYVYPWLISSALIRGEIAQLSAPHRASARMEAWLSLLLAWWLVPIVLLFYWARYLVSHDWGGTLLHVVLVVLTSGLALHFFRNARNALREIARNAGLSGTDSRGPEANSVFDLWRTRVGSAAGLLILVSALIYLSASAIRGLSIDACANAGIESGCGLYSLGRNAWKVLGVEPYADVKEEHFVVKPGNWRELLADPSALSNYLEAQRALVLVGRDLRGISASEAFLPGSRIQGSTLDYADLRHAVLMGSRLEDISLRGANLTDADLQHAKIINASLEEIFAQAARFNHASFSGATSEKRTRLSGDFSGVFFDHARGDKLLFHSGDGLRGQTSLRETSLRETNFKWSDFERVDLSGARIEEATLTGNNFVETDFSRATIHGATLSNSTFTRCRFIATEIQDSVFEDVRFVDSEFDRTPTRAASSSQGDRASPPPHALRQVIVQFRGFGATFGAKSRIRNMEFVKADLRFARFEDIEFENTLFSASDLSGATFQDADLSKVEFEGVDLSGANLERARNLTPRLLNRACGNAKTRLPLGLTIGPCPRSGA